MMNRKRSLMPDVYKTRKRICTGPAVEAATHSANWYAASPAVNNVPSDTKAALLLLRNIFPREKFEGRLPSIVMKHQLYSLLKNRTLVDKELGDLRANGEVRLFKLGADAGECCLLLMEDYRSHVSIHAAQLGVSMHLIDRFLSLTMSQCSDLCLTKETLMVDFYFKDEEITQLVKASVLTVRDVGSWWVAIPSAGMFLKTFTRGRKAVLTMIRKCKYREILQKDLEERKLPKVARLGMLYHIHDIIGAELVQCIDTTAGQLLRLTDT